jgi:hypothetical protein
MLKHAVPRASPLGFARANQGTIFSIPATRRDIGYLVELEAVHAIRPAENQGVVLSINLAWPIQITETEFFRRIKEMPKGKVYGFLSR